MSSYRKVAKRPWKIDAFPPDVVASAVSKYRSGEWGVARFGQEFGVKFSAAQNWLRRNEVPTQRIIGDEHARFWSKVNKTETCWLWTGALNEEGYGVFRVEGAQRNVLAHRFAYEESFGPVPEGRELDHLCRTPPCLNPSHLEPVTHTENMRRASHATKNACHRGHAYDASNTRRDKSWRRRCRECTAEHNRKRRERRSAT